MCFLFPSCFLSNFLAQLFFPFCIYLPISTSPCIVILFTHLECIYGSTRFRNPVVNSISDISIPLLVLQAERRALGKRLIHGAASFYSNHPADNSHTSLKRSAQGEILSSNETYFGEKWNYICKFRHLWMSRLHPQHTHAVTHLHSVLGVGFFHKSWSL